MQNKEEVQNNQKLNYQQQITLNKARDVLREFAKERDWNQFHTPRNLMLALVGEIGQLSQIFQWKGQVQAGLKDFPQTEKIHLGEQLADVFNYLIRLSDVCGVDLNKAFLDKIQKNKKKYPADLVKGSSKKYIEYKLQSRKQKAEEILSKQVKQKENN